MDEASVRSESDAKHAVSIKGWSIHRGSALVALMLTGALILATDRQGTLGLTLKAVSDVDSSRGLASKTPEVPLPMPIDNDNERFPGLFMNNQLYFLGARLTSSYDKFDDSLSFDLFGHALGEGSNAKWGLAKKETGDTLTYAEASQQALVCQVHHDNNKQEELSQESSVEMELVDPKSLDRNTINVQLLWRCNISPHLSKSDLLASGQSHVRVSVYTSPTNHTNPGERIFTVDVPLDTANVGHAGPVVKSSQQPSFLQTVAQSGPLGVVLCVAGVSGSAMWYLPEFIQHHLNVGVEQIFLGMDDQDELPYYTEKLAYYIEQGVVVLGTDPIIPEGPHNPRFEHRGVRKLRFYQQCLYHAKGMSEFLAVWDVDELWIPPKDTFVSHQPLSNTTKHGLRRLQQTQRRLQVADHIQKDQLWRESPYRKAMSLPQAARLMRGKNGCTEWCFQTFASYTVQKVHHRRDNATDVQEQGYYGFPVRDAKPNFIWQKPIIKTKYAHQATYHIGGGCRRPDAPIRNENEGGDVYTTGYNRQFADCPLLPEPNDALGTMHHYLVLFRQSGVQKKREKFPDDEYEEHMRSTTLQQLKQLRNDGLVMAENPVWLREQQAGKQPVQ